MKGRRGSRGGGRAALLAVLLAAVLASMAARPREARAGGAQTLLEPPFQARVVAIQDGDTLTVLRDGREVRIRLEGIDCPERAQPWSQRAKQLTGALAMGRSATLRPVDVDRYGRTVARVLVEGRDVSVELLRAGLAWHYKRYNQEPELARLEAEARAARRGLWADPDPIAPWEWRRRGRAGGP